MQHAFTSDNLARVLEPGTRLQFYKSPAPWVEVPSAGIYANDAWDEALAVAVPRLARALAALPGAWKPGDMAGARSAKTAYSDFWGRVGEQSAQADEVAEALAFKGHGAAAAAVKALTSGLKSLQVWPHRAIPAPAWTAFLVRLRAEAERIAMLAGQQRALM